MVNTTYGKVLFVIADKDKLRHKALVSINYPLTVVLAELLVVAVKPWLLCADTSDNCVVVLGISVLLGNPFESVA